MTPTYTITILHRYLSGGKYHIDFKIEGVWKKRRYILCLSTKTPMMEETPDEVFTEWLLSSYSGLKSAYEHINNQLKDSEEE